MAPNSVQRLTRSRALVSMQMGGDRIDGPTIAVATKGSQVLAKFWQAFVNDGERLSRFVLLRHSLEGLSGVV